MGFAEDLGAIIKFKPQVKFNTNRTDKRGRRLSDGIEIRFGKNKPTEEVRELLKKHGFQFSEKNTEDKKWWAHLSDERKAFVEDFANQEVNVDDAQYEKLFFWPTIKSTAEYEKLNYYTEFMVKETPPEYYHNKGRLEDSYDTDALIAERQLAFKKFYNKPIDGESQEQPSPDEAEENSIVDAPENNSMSNLRAETLEHEAKKLEPQIQEKLNNPVHKQNPTRKRKEYAKRLLEEAAELLARQIMLQVLAKAHRDKTIYHYPLLDAIRSVSDINLITIAKPGEQNSAWAGRFFEKRIHSFKQLGIHSIENWGKCIDQLIALLEKYKEQNGVTNGSPDKIKIAQLENELRGKNIPGFFPSPPAMVDEVLKLANIQDGDTILEPSAGKGDILDGIKRTYPSFKLTLEACEINYNLREILQLKGYKIVAHDFTEYHPTYQYDKIVMNPPFEKAQDVDHVLHAYKMLKPGGTLVAIMGEGAFFRQFNKEKKFRQFLTDHYAYVSDTYEGAFANSFNPTNIRTRIIQLVKPAEETAPVPESAYDQDGNNEAELLELEALAEMELVKLRVEIARKKKASTLKGFSSKAWSLENDWDVLNFK